MDIQNDNIGISRGGDDINNENRNTNLKKNQYRIRLSDEEVKFLDFCSEKLNITKADVIRKGISMVYEEIKK